MRGKFSVKRQQTVAASVPTGEIFSSIFLFYRYVYVFCAIAAFSSSSSLPAVLSNNDLVAINPAVWL